MKRVLSERRNSNDFRSSFQDMKELGKPKRPVSSYFLFCRTENDKMGELGLVKFQQHMKEKWNNLTVEQKDEWKIKAERLMKKYLYVF